MWIMKVRFYQPWHVMHVQGPCLHKTQTKAYVDIGYGRDLCGHRIWATVNQNLPVHHPLDACYYSVVDEPQLNYYLVSPW
jgi:hypothetical protein